MKLVATCSVWVGRRSPVVRPGRGSHRSNRRTRRARAPVKQSASGIRPPKSMGLSSSQLPAGMSILKKSKKQLSSKLIYRDWKVLQFCYSSEAPVCTASIDTQDLQTCVLFNAWDKFELCTNGKCSVFFWTWEIGQPSQFYSPVRNLPSLSSPIRPVHESWSFRGFNRFVRLNII